MYGTLDVSRPYRYHWYNEGEYTYPPSKPSTRDKWVVNYGIHRHTLTSRESGALEGRSFGSFTECRDAIKEIADGLAKHGYVIWYSYAIAPDGTAHHITAEVGYQR